MNGSRFNVKGLVTLHLAGIVVKIILCYSLTREDWCDIDSFLLALKRKRGAFLGWFYRVRRVSEICAVEEFTIWVREASKIEEHRCMVIGKTKAIAPSTM